MSDMDDNETQGVVFGVLAGVILGVIALVAGLGIWKVSQPTSVPVPTAVVEAVEVDIAPQGEALAKVYFEIGEAAFKEADRVVIVQVVEALAAKPEGIVLLSGFHDASGDPAHNAKLAKQRAKAVSEVLLAGGVPLERVKFRKPESTVGTGSPEEGRRVEIRVQ